MGFGSPGRIGRFLCLVQDSARAAGVGLMGGFNRWVGGFCFPGRNNKVKALARPSGLLNYLRRPGSVEVSS